MFIVCVDVTEFVIVCVAAHWCVIQTEMWCIIRVRKRSYRAKYYFKNWILFIM